MAEATIIAAVIGAAATVSSAIIQKRKGREEGKREAQEKFEEESEAAARSLQEELVTRFGWKADAAESSYTADSGGGVHVERTWRGVRATEGTTISHIPGAFWVGTPGGRIAEYPVLRKMKEFKKALELRVELEEKRCAYRVEIPGSLTAQDPPLDFSIEVKHDKAVLLTRDAVARAYSRDHFPYDYHSLDVDIPVDELTIEVRLPGSLSAKAYPMVFLGRSELEHHGELHRVENGFEPTEDGGRFKVREPLVGFRYAIFWQLPS